MFAFRYLQHELSDTALRLLGQQLLPADMADLEHLSALQSQLSQAHVDSKVQPAVQRACAMQIALSLQGQTLPAYRRRCAHIFYSVDLLMHRRVQSA